MKRQSQIASDRSRTTSRKLQASSKMADKTDDLQADKQALSAELHSDVSSQPESSTGKVIKKRAAVSPVQNVQSEKRRRASLDVHSSSEGRKKLSKLQKKQGDLEMCLSEPRTKGKHMVVGETKGSLELEAGEKKLNLQNSIKDSFKDLKEGVAQEVRRLATTDGFWSSKTTGTSRSNSPIIMAEQGDGPLPQKTSASSLRGGRNSTPDVSPSSSKTRVSLKQHKKDLESEELAKLNQLLELKRLKTTDGFWSPNLLPLGPRTVSSRDGSPSSASSSLERVSKTNKPLVQPNEEVVAGTSAKQEKKLTKSKLVTTTSSGNEAEKSTAYDSTPKQDINQNTNSVLLTSPGAALSVKHPRKSKKLFPAGGEATLSGKKIVKKKQLPVSINQVVETLTPEDVTLKVPRPRGRPKTVTPKNTPKVVRSRGRPKKEEATPSAEEINSVSVASTTEMGSEEQCANNVQGEITDTSLISQTPKPKRGRPKSVDPKNKQVKELSKSPGRPKKYLGLPNKIGKLPYKSKFGQVVKVKKLKRIKLKVTNKSMELEQGTSLNQSKVKVRNKVKLKLNTEQKTIFNSEEKAGSSENVLLEKKLKRKKKGKVFASENVITDLEQSVSVEPENNLSNLADKTEVADVTGTQILKAKKGRKKINLQDTSLQGLTCGFGEAEMATSTTMQESINIPPEPENIATSIADKTEFVDVTETPPIKAKKGRKKKNLHDISLQAIPSDVAMVTSTPLHESINVPPSDLAQSVGAESENNNSNLADKTEVVVQETPILKAKKGRKKKILQDTALQAIPCDVEMATSSLMLDSIKLPPEPENIDTSVADKTEVVDATGTPILKSKKGRKKKKLPDTSSQAISCGLRDVAISTNSPLQDSIKFLASDLALNVSAEPENNVSNSADKTKLVDVTGTPILKGKKGRKKKCLQDTSLQAMPCDVGVAEMVTSSPMHERLKTPTSDIRITTELKRLNTTAGFWAPTPDLGSVLSMPNKRRSVLNNKTVSYNYKKSKNTSQLPGFPKPLKPESSLLQHRKKKLNALKQALHKVRHISRSGPDSEQGTGSSSVDVDSIGVGESSSVTDTNVDDTGIQITKKVNKLIKRKKGLPLVRSYYLDTETASGSIINRSKQILRKESETVANVNKQIEETESLIKVDVKELEEANLLNTRTATTAWNITDKSPVLKVAEEMEVDSAKKDKCDAEIGTSLEVTPSSVEEPLTDDKDEKTFSNPILTPLDNKNSETILSGLEESSNSTQPATQQKQIITISEYSVCHSVSGNALSTTVNETPTGHKPQRENIFDVFSHTVTETKLVSEETSAQFSRLPQGKAEVSSNEITEKLALIDPPEQASCSHTEQDLKSVLTPEEIIKSHELAEADDTAKSEASNILSHSESMQSDINSFPTDVVTPDTDLTNVITKDNLLKDNCILKSPHDSNFAVKPENENQPGNEICIPEKEDVCLPAICKEQASAEADQDTAKVQHEDLSCAVGTPQAEEEEEQSLACNLGPELYTPVGSKATKLKSKLSRMEFIGLKKTKKKKSKKLLFVKRKTHRPALLNVEQYTSDSMESKSETETSSRRPVSSLSQEITVASDSLSTSEDKPVSFLQEEEAPPKAPIRRVRKKKRNSWKKGVVKKSTYFAHKLKKRLHTELAMPKIKLDDTTSKLLLAKDDGPKVSGDEHLTTAENIPSVGQIVLTDNTLSEKRVRMLSRLKTNANLANAVLNEEVLKGRFLRRSHPKDDSEPELRRERAPVDSTTALRVEIPDETKRKRGRPRKLSCSLPKLTPPDMSGPLSMSLTGKSPPHLSPQVDPVPNKNGPPPNLFTFDDYRSSNDGDVAFENVDETDLHLYLSGVSDEDQSPQKDTVCSVDLPQTGLALENTEALNLGVSPSAAVAKLPQDVLKPVPQLSPPRKVGRPKMKGRRGKPPGMPMTEEEKKKKRNKADAKRAKNADKLLQTLSTDDQQPNIDQFLKLPRTARKSLKSPVSSTTFTLRKKSTRSPLEMLEMKRRQEEAIYDLEEERKQARRILLREKRFAKEICEGYFAEDLQIGELVIKPCSVILSDFVKKLQLDSFESLSDNSSQEDPDNSLSISPQKVSSFEENLEDEDWCADLENPISDEEWRVNEMLGDRPYIPRLKLKRVLKKDKAFDGGEKKSPMSSTPKSEKEPIKIVIKSEPIADSSSGGLKSGVDLSKVERSGFEGSYVDFLKDCHDQNSRKHVSKKKSYVSKPVQDHLCQGTEVSPPDEGASPASATPSETMPKENAARKSSLALMGEEEDEDILIVDLEEGAQDQNSVDSNKDSENVTSNKEKCRPDKPEGRIQRTVSNDEMGLMFASYHNGNDTGAIDKESLSRNSPTDLSIKDSVTMVAADITKDNEDVVGSQENSVLLNKVEESVKNKQVSEASLDKPSASSLCKESPAESLSEQSKEKNVSEDSVSISPKAAVDAHKKSTHSPTHCTLMDNTPEGWRLKAIHQKDKLSSCQYKCKNCDFTSSVRLSIEAHIYGHIPGVQFRCAFCKSEFSSFGATVMHLKNSHPVKEAHLYISRHIEETSFYEKDETIVPEECAPCGKSQTASVGAGGQSPPLNILLVVSHGRSSAAPRRYVCTHCGFSTNIKEDAEHHKNDLHGSENLFACLLCKETMFSSEVEIRHHSSSVHPLHSRSYRKLPDYYDSEHLSAKGKSPSQEDRDNIFDKITSIIQVDKSGQDTASVDHRQKAKDYLYLQEEWKEKTMVEADSTTEFEHIEDSLAEAAASDSLAEAAASDSLAEAAASSKTVASAEIVSGDSVEGKAVCENEASSGDVGKADARKATQGVAPDITITSSVVPASVPENTSEEAITTFKDKTDQNALESSDKSISEVLKGVESSDSVLEDAAASTNSLDTSSEEPMGLKIVQVVSLSEPSENSMTDPMVQEVMDSLAEATNQQGDDETNMPDRRDDTEGGVSTVDVPQDLSVKKPGHSRQPTQQESPAVPSPTPTPSPGQSSGQSTSGGLPLSYKCNACKVHTPYLLMMVKHLKARHPNMRCFACPYCKAIDSFVSQKQLRHHVRSSHPEKIGRNEIALSEEAKKFVEAMVLPNSTECIRVGNRVVLEEDIHTCTYCQLKMTSLAQVYEHLNNQHSDLFEFVCPICQGFKSKLLSEISMHCMQVHNSALDTDKVHVSVPKNLFHVLTCISKAGKYIEKSLAPPEDATSKLPTAAEEQLGSQTPITPHQNPADVCIDSSKLSQGIAPVMTPLLSSVQHLPSGHQQVPHMVFSQAPLIAIPLLPGNIGSLPSSATPRPLIAFSSALFDTSTLTTPPQLITSNATAPLTVIPSTAGAASFLSPGFHLPNTPDLHGKSPTPSVRQHKPKHLPVLNVPHIKTRISQPAADQQPRNISSQSAPVRPVNPSTYEANNLPESDPDPDAFKIFNLCPTAPVASHSSSALPSGNMQMVFPPVSSVNTAFIQGPIAGFPPGMVLPQNLFPIAFNHPQQMVMASRPASHKSRQTRPPTAQPPTSTSAAASRSNSIASYYGNSQQPRNVSMTREQVEMYRQRHVQPQMSAHSMGPPPIMHYQHPVPETTQQTLDLASRHSNVQQSLSGGAHAMPSGTSMLSKGIHKRSSSIYQCPYCPQMVPLKALEVPSHIQQYHPGHQVTFKKIAH